MKNIKSKISVFIALCIGTTACNSTDNKTWHCYDRQGNPAEGVVIISRWGLPECNKSGVTCRISDANGKIVLDLDADTPPGLDRGDECIYSSKLRCGSVGMGKRWHETEPGHEIQPIPDTPVYFDEWNNKIYLKSGVNDPVIWHNALNHFILSYSASRNHPNGGAKLNAYLSVLVSRERALFLEKYGEQIVPQNYNYTVSLDTLVTRYSYLSKRNNANLKFKDITNPLPKP